MNNHVTWTTGDLPPSMFVLDITVNPRTGNDGWVHKQLGPRRADGTYPGYKPDLLGTFEVSMREGADGEEPVYVLLDGANRRRMMEIAGDLERQVHCKIAHGMSLQEEAAHARGINERQTWTAVRRFLAGVTAGDPESVRILTTLQASNWSVEINGGDGTLRGVTPLQKLLRTAERLSIRNTEEKRVRKGTEQYAAIIQDGRAIGFGALEDAVAIMTAAWPQRTSQFSADIIYGIGLVILRYGRRVKMEKMTEALQQYQGGKRTLIASARSVCGVHQGWKLADGIAHIAVEQYNRKFSSRAGDRLDQDWHPIAV